MLDRDLVVQVLAPIGRDTELLTTFLERAGIRAAIATDSLEHMTAEERDRSGALLIAEEALTPCMLHHLTELLARQPFWSDLPILVLTAASRESSETRNYRRDRLPLNQSVVLERPLHPAALLSAVNSALRARQRQFQVREATLQRDAVGASLRASEEQYRLILQSTRDCITLLDLEGKLLSMNEEGLTRLGIADFASVRGALWFELWEAEYRQLARGAAHTALDGHEGRFEGFLLRPDGEPTWWDVSVTPVRNQSGETTQLLAVSREITDRKLAQEALIQSEKLAAVGRLASSIAHEINNPLEAVTNLLYLAKEKTISNEVREYLETADQELRRVSVIANQTLRFHKQSTLPRAVSAADLFSTVLIIYEGRLKNSHIRVETDFRATRPVICFEGDVRQVLNNLISNAIDAMSGGGGRLLLRSHEVSGSDGVGGGMVLTVADTGTGISPEVAEKIFDPFFTTKGFSGTGLGLWVSKQVVARHNGSLRVRSSRRPDRSGSVFRFFLPFSCSIENGSLPN